MIHDRYQNISGTEPYENRIGRRGGGGGGLGAGISYFKPRQLTRLFFIFGIMFFTCLTVVLFKGCWARFFK